MDTYDTLEGVSKAAAVAKEMKQRGHALRAVRLDSGDLLDLSKKSRALLDETGLGHVQVFASGGLDEFEIDALLSAGAPIDGFGVGTKVGVSADAPWTDCAYKLVEYGGKPRLKLSPKKQTLPGRKQVYRSRDGDGAYLRDVISLAEEGAPERGAEPLLRQVMTEGRSAEPPDSLERLRERFAEEFSRLPDRYKALRSPALYRVSTSTKLESLRKAVSRQVGDRERAQMR